MSMDDTQKKKHDTVLLEESVRALELDEGDTAIDATVGVGGHAEMISHTIGEKGTLVVLDADERSLALARERLKEASATIVYIHGNFRNLKQLVSDAGVSEADGILFDLGWHIEQLEGRGLSFKADEPLLMTLSGKHDGFTAADIIADWDEDEIARIIREYGEERFSKRIARAIVEARRREPINTAKELAEIISHAVPAFYRRPGRSRGRGGRLNPATRTFQALRIAVNDELNALTDGLRDAIDLISSGGRVAAISFHSLEDRIVKREFRAAEDNGVGKRITKKPLVPTTDERAKNPRARSAKLRIFEKN